MEAVMSLAGQQLLALSASGLAMLLLSVCVVLSLRGQKRPREQSDPQGVCGVREAVIIIRAGQAEALNEVARKALGAASCTARDLAQALLLSDGPGFDAFIRDSVDPGRAPAGPRQFPTKDDRVLDIRADPDGWQVRLSVLDVTRTAAREQLAVVQAQRFRDAFDRVSDLARRAPVLQWRQAADGRVIWSNVDAFARLGWEESLLARLMALPCDRDAEGIAHAFQKRVSLDDTNHPDGKVWFEVTHVPDMQDEVLSYAVPAQKVVDAENSLSRFVETLTETFAHLPTGLAIFDRNRELGLFNPALSHLLGLDPAWMAARPSLAVVLNTLRERRAIPDQSDFRSWRDALLHLGTPGHPDHYEEEWLQPSGRTLRVVARPHPHGAMALLVVDITTDLELERQFRARSDMRDAVLELDGTPRVIIDMDGTVRYAAPEVERFSQEALEQALPPRFAAFLDRLNERFVQDASLDVARMTRFISRAGKVDTVLFAPLRTDVVMKLQKLRGGATLATFRGPLVDASMPSSCGGAGAGEVLQDVLRQNDHLFDLIVLAPPLISDDFSALSCERPDLMRRVVFNMLLSMSEIGRNRGTMQLAADRLDDQVVLSVQLVLATRDNDVIGLEGLLPVTLLRRYVDAEGGTVELTTEGGAGMRVLLPLTTLQPVDSAVVPAISAAG
ncbi:PAS-domain containing protein [Pontivivens insulae]|uniref:Sensor protein DivL n=1 Tax=Pontivivens insulae TaxID=1639689 RepID=A0A2R8AFJ9_9RHOB|nr:PAS-domain containing protein [Pontivivens insulae]RED12089.1 PAS domain-containing protein [Pontivivens insulae]SPF30845.1 Sensor protein DivL [Pontivivens insulae]